MPAVIPCPAAADFDRLLCGRLSPSSQEAILHHLQGCEHCAGIVEGLLGRDALVESLRFEEGGGTQPAAVGRLIQRLKSLPPATEETVASAPDASSPAVGRGEGGPATAAAGDDFLAPPRGPGELGRLGDCRVLKLLGAGGMGMVYHAEDVRLQRPVALKVMKPEAAKNPTARERFLREAQAAGVKSDHVVTIYQVGEDGPVAFLAMEFLWPAPGRTVCAPGTWKPARKPSTAKRPSAASMPPCGRQTAGRWHIAWMPREVSPWSKLSPTRSPECWRTAAARPSPGRRTAARSHESMATPGSDSTTPPQGSDCAR